MTALKDVAGIAGYHSSNCDNEVEMISKVSSDVTVELGFTPSKDFDDLVGIGAGITEIKSKLILQSEQVKVIVLVGPPGIGKTELPEFYTTNSLLVFHSALFGRISKEVMRSLVVTTTC